MLMAQLWAQSGGTPPQEAAETESVSAMYSPHVASGQSIGLRASSSISGLTPTWLSHLGHSGIREGNGHGSLFPRIPMLFMPRSVFVDSEDPQKGFDQLFTGGDWRKGISRKCNASLSPSVPHLLSHYSHCTQEAKPLIG